MTDEMDENRVLVRSWLLKKAGKTHQWQKRWAVLRNCQLSYYENESEHKPSRVINRNELLLFAKISGHHKFQFAVYTSKKTFQFRVETEQLFQQWYQALSDLILPSHNDDLADEEVGNLEEIPKLTDLKKTKENREYLVEEGFLLLLKPRLNQWKKCYVIVSNMCLYLCKSDDKSQRPEKLISVDRLLDVVEVDTKKGKRWCLMLIEGRKTHYLSALSEAEMAKFLLAIKAVIQYRGTGGR